MVEVKEKNVVDLNRLNFGGSGRPGGMYFQGEVNQAYFGSTKVYNRSLYHMESPWDGYFPTDARPFELKTMLAYFNFSWKKDLAGANKDVQETVEWYMEDPGQEVLPGNEDEENAKDTEFTITQNISGLQVTGLVRQAKDRVLRTEYSQAEITSVGYPQDAPAAGFDGLPLLVTYSGYKNSVWASGKETAAVPWGGTIRSGFLSIDGYSLSDDVYFDSSTGEVDAPYLADTPMDERQIAVVTHVRISTDAGELEWTGEAYLKQAANVKSNVGSPTYDIHSFPSSTLVGGEETYIYIHIAYADKTQGIRWTSGYEDSETEDTYVRLSASVGTLDDSILYGANYTRLVFGRNGSSERNITVRVYNTAAGYDVTHTITQEAYVEPEVWEYPQLNGNIAWEVPASGEAVEFLVPIIQRKYQGSTLKETFTGSVRATSISGTAYAISGAEFSGGFISCQSMGTTEYPDGRRVYTVNSVTVTGKDGLSYTLQYSTPQTIMQAQNIVEMEDVSNYKVSLSSDASQLEPYGQSAVITVTATKDRDRTYSSGETESLKNIKCYATLSTTHGNLSATSVASGGTATFTPHSNDTAEDRKLTVTAEHNDKTSVTSTLEITQKKAEFNFSISGSTSVSAEGGLVTLTVINTVNGGFLTLDTSNVSVTNGSVQSVTLNDVLMDRYTVVVDINKNPSTSSRSAVVTVTQPKSGTKKTHTITQAGVSVTEPEYKASVEAWWNGYAVYWDVVVEADLYETIDITIRLQDAPDRYGIIYYEETATVITNMDTASGSYDFGGSMGIVYVVVYDPLDQVIGYRIVE